MKLFMLVLFIIKILVESKLLKAEGRETRDQIADHPLDQRERKEFQKTMYFRFITTLKPFDYIDHNKLWEIL